MFEIIINMVYLILHKLSLSFFLLFSNCEIKFWGTSLAFEFSTFVFIIYNQIWRTDLDITLWVDCSTLIALIELIFFIFESDTTWI